MTSHTPRRASLLAVLLLAFLASSPATASPVDYIIFDTDTLLQLGTFTVDPALANPMGASSVEVSAFSITETLGSFGSVTATLAQRISSGGPYARFVNGQITSFSSNTQYVLPGEIAVNVDIVPEGAPTDLNFVAVLQMWAANYPNLDGQVTGSSRGIGLKETVPEPATIFLLGAGGAATLFRRRRQKTAIQQVV